MAQKGKLGILGGMGPQATQVFYQRILDRTDAESDQENIPTLILSDTHMPDRTAAILSGDTREIEARLLAGARLLEDWGAACIAIPCNTSHVFVPHLQEQLGIPIVNMIAETAAALKSMGAKRVGVLATEGTVRAGLYHTACGEVGVEAVSPGAPIQALVTGIIYDEIKKGEQGSREKFSAIDTALREMGCDRAVLGCTELSVYKGWHSLPGYYVDAMDVLATRCVELCGYPVRNV